MTHDHRSHARASIRSIMNRTTALAAGVVIIAPIGLWGCASSPDSSPQTSSQHNKQSTQSLSAVAGDGTITVALYPYVPDLNEFKTELTTAWGNVVGAPPLEFVSWDCYSSDKPPADLDVFVFDGIFMSQFASSGYLREIQPGEIANRSDFLPYAIEGARYESDLYGIPQIGCTNILYYRSGDSALADATSLEMVHTALGDATYTTAQPPQGVGFMMDFSGGTTCACNYVVAEESYTNIYSKNPPLPPASDLNPWALANLQEMVAMAGVAQASWSDQVDYQRAVWFNQGSGRAMVGFSEAMSQMGDILDNVRFKEMPMANAAGFSLFYVDIVGINSTVVGTSDEPWALKLANLISSHDYITDVFENDGEPQYLYPVRRSVFETLGASYPKYADLYDLVQNVNPAAFRLGPDVRTWLADNKSEIRCEILQCDTQPARGRSKAD